MQNEDNNIDEQNYVIALAGAIEGEIGKTKFLLGGEVRKEISTSNQYVQDLIARLKKKDEYNEPDATVKPDYVIHYSVKREDINEEKQKLVIEAKTTKQLTQDPFSWDLYKLMSYVNELKYESAIYLILNTRKEKVEELLEGYRKQNLPIIRIPEERLFFFIQENIESSPEIYWLDCSEE